MDHLDKQLNLSALLAQLWRRKAFVFTMVGLTTLAATLIVFQLPPQYSATAKVLIGDRQAKVLDIDNVLATLRSDRASVKSEAEVLSSRLLTEKVVDGLGLMDLPEFNESLRPPPLFFLLKPFASASWRGIVAFFSADSPELPEAPEEIERKARSRVITALHEAVVVENVANSRVLSVTATSKDPKLAAAIANTLSDLYLREQLEAKFAATERASRWLNERVGTLRRQVEASEQAVEEYRRQHGLTQSENASLIEQQISELSTQLMLAKAKTAEAKAKLQQTLALANSDGGADSASEVLDSPLIQKMRVDEADVARQAAEMAVEYGLLHPRRISIEAELENIRAKIKGEVDKIARSLSSDLAIARSRERALEQSLRSLRDEAAKLNASQGGLRVLEREAAANKELFDTLLSRWKETGEQEELQRADARVIERADVPREPASPKKGKVMAISFVLSVLAAVLAVFVIEQIDHGFRSTEEVESWLEVNVLGLVPLLDGPALKEDGLPFAYVLKKPVSRFAESLRMLHTGLLLSNVESESMSVLITSAVPGEGKTTIAIALARLAARSGQKVLLIDGDLRTCDVGKQLGLSAGHGLVDLLADRRTPFGEVVQHDGESGLDILTSGRDIQVLYDLFLSSRMEEVMKALRPNYDLIVVDSPPVLVVSDAQILAQSVDKTVLVVQWRETRRELASLALRKLNEIRSSVAGAVLSKVDIRSRSQYGDFGEGYYLHYGLSGKHHPYYTD